MRTRVPQGHTSPALLLIYIHPLPPSFYNTSLYPPPFFFCFVGTRNTRPGQGKSKRDKSRSPFNYCRGRDKESRLWRAKLQISDLFTRPTDKQKINAPCACTTRRNHCNINHEKKTWTNVGRMIHRKEMTRRQSKSRHGDNSAMILEHITRIWRVEVQSSWRIRAHDIVRRSS